MGWLDGWMGEMNELYIIMRKGGGIQDRLLTHSLLLNR